MSGQALPRLLACDMAGTTIRDEGQVPRAFAAALAARGLELAPDRLLRVRGATKRHALRGLLPDGPGRDALAEAIHLDFKRRLLDDYAAGGVRAVEGAVEALTWARRRGVRVVLTTGFDREIADLLIGALGWDRGLLDGWVGGDEVERGRPAPDLIRAAMARAGIGRAEEVACAGDTALDLEAAHRAGAGWNIGVLSGAHDRSTLARAPHTHLVDSVGALPRLFDGPAEGAPRGAAWRSS